MATMRLQRFLAQAGVASRRKAEELILAGRVRINGKVVRELGSKVDTLEDRMTDRLAVMDAELGAPTQMGVFRRCA